MYSVHLKHASFTSCLTAHPLHDVHHVSKLAALSCYMFSWFQASYRLSTANARSYSAPPLLACLTNLQPGESCLVITEGRNALQFQDKYGGSDVLTKHCR